MTGCERRHAEDVHVVFNGHAGCFLGSLEERAHIHVEAAVGVAGGYHLGAAVVAVLAHLGNHDTGLAAFALGEFLAHLLGADEVGVLFCFR